MPHITETIDQRFDDPERASELAKMLNLRWTEIEQGADGPLYGHGTEYQADGGCWAVLTDDEADTAWNESLESYLDECVLEALPEIAQQYFDRESWKRNARMDGRGHSLSGYDGEERDAGEYVVFRSN